MWDLTKHCYIGQKSILFRILKNSMVVNAENVERSVHGPPTMKDFSLIIRYHNIFADLQFNPQC
jgi:hypothetical protein